MSRASELKKLPAEAPCYIDGFGLCTVGEVRESKVPEETAALADPMEPTLAMWEHFILHPRCTREEWLRLQDSGPILPASEARPE